MTVYTWILIALFTLAALINMFAPLKKVRKPETMVERGLSLLFGAAALVYLVFQLNP